MKLITLYLPETYIKLLDELIAERFYPNRAEAIRISVRSLLSEHDKFTVHSKFEAKTDYKPPSERQLAAVERLVELQSRKSPLQKSGVS
jgi:Arc/MetJ-type ribon-helix-helix transcriptional regulator